MTTNNIKHIIKEYSIFFIFFGLILLLTIVTKGKFLTFTNISNIIRQVSIIGIIAYGVTFVIITAGIDLSSGSVLAFISVVIASLLQTDRTGTYIRYESLPPIPVILVVILALIIGAMIGAVNGSLIVWAKIPPFISTLGMFTIARGLAFLYSNGRPLSGLNPDFNAIGTGFSLGISNPIWILVLLGVVSHVILSHTRLGRFIYAIGANKKAAYVSGINTHMCTLFVYVFATFLVAVASIIQTARIGSGQAGLGVSFELYAIASAVIGGTSFSGGKGTIIGTFIGALIIGIIRNGMDIIGINANWQQVALGAIIIFAVVLDQQKNKTKT